MNLEPKTLYKLMILYMLDNISLPMTNAQLSSFFMGKEYTSYFSLQNVLAELTDSGLIDCRRSGTSARYEITPDGHQSLVFFASNLPSGAILDIDNYLKLHKLRLISEAGTTSDYYQTPAGSFCVHCEVREGHGLLFSMDLSAPDENTAAQMCGRWRDNSQEIYDFAMRSLLSKKATGSD